MRFLLVLVSLIAFDLSPKEKKVDPQTFLNKNLLLNPSSEICNLEVPENWIPFSINLDDKPTCTTYGKYPGEWKVDCNEKCGLPPEAGKFYFRFPLENLNNKSESSYSQIIDLSVLAAMPGKTNLEVQATGYIAGSYQVNLECSYGFMNLEFLDSSNKPVDSFEYTKTNYSMEKISLHPKEQMNFRYTPMLIRKNFPKNASKVKLTIGARGQCGDKDTGYAYIFIENLNLTVLPPLTKK
jgi:hypothetical protein